MTETKTSVRERLTKEIEHGLVRDLKCSLPLDFELVVAARDLIVQLEKRVVELEEKNTELEERCLYGRLI